MVQRKGEGVRHNFDEAVGKRRSESEIALLKSIRDQVGRLRKDASAVLHRLYSEVDSID